jgi:hypothetical protein
MVRARENPLTSDAVDLVAAASRSLGDYNRFSQAHARVLGRQAVEDRFPGAVTEDVYAGGDCIMMAVRPLQKLMSGTVRVFGRNPLLPLVTPCCPLLPLVTPCCPLLPLVAPCYPLLPLVTPCCPLLPLVTPCYPVTYLRFVSPIALDRFGSLWIRSSLGSDCLRPANPTPCVASGRNPISACSSRRWREARCPAEVVYDRRSVAWVNR